MKPTIAMLDDMMALCREAGDAILAIHREQLDTQLKDDDSPVTAADLAANDVLMRGLRRLAPEIPILSEEQAEIAWEERRQWPRYWLVDPLDGTREFLGDSGQYTVNIALIEGHDAVLGAVHAPALGISWGGGAGLGAWRYEQAARVPIAVASQQPLRIVASRSHLDAETQAFMALFPEAQISNAGSSLKFCRIAEGEADVYPRFGPTCEWDTAAAQAVLEAAGGQVLEATSLEPLHYNQTADLRNPHFIACADAQGAWRRTFKTKR
ncbi:3'(2'),5'-bisphosphate nucleotidase CysQ [Halomonas sp. WWR20]